MATKQQKLESLLFGFALRYYAKRGYDIVESEFQGKQIRKGKAMYGLRVILAGGNIFEPMVTRTYFISAEYVDKHF